MHHVPTAPHACGASFVPSGRGMIVSMSRAKVSRRSGPGCNMRLYTMAFMGMAPVGSLVAGSMAMQLTAPHMVRIGGLCCLVGALVFARHLPALRALVRPLSAHREILQDTTVREPTAMEVSLHAHH